mmetsp:Transcript_16918/g.42478  ORF Transcript_16918/g.42478 Transcript_16918/m.42478 type:complete len:611 (+) Transcript_16918:253-2085(+)
MLRKVVLLRRRRRLLGRLARLARRVRVELPLLAVQRAVLPALRLQRRQVQAAVLVAVVRVHRAGLRLVHQVRLRRAARLHLHEGPVVLCRLWQRREHDAPLRAEHLVGVKLLGPGAHQLRAVVRRRAAGRVREVGDHAVVPVLEHQARGGGRVGGAALLQLAPRARDELQELVDALKLGDLVQLHQLLGGAAAQHLLHRRHRVRQLLHLDAVPEHAGHAVLVAVEHDSGGVQQLDGLVQVDLLHGLCHAWGVADVGDAGALERVDEGGLAHVGQADDTHGDGRLDAAVARVVLQQLQQRVRAQALPARPALPATLLALLAAAAALPQVGRLLLRGALEGDGGQLLAQVLQPRLHVLARHQVHLVQQQHDLLVRVHAAHEALHVGAAARQRVARIKHLNDHIGILHHLHKLLVESAAGAVQIGIGACDLGLLLGLKLRLLPLHSQLVLLHGEPRAGGRLLHLLVLCALDRPRRLAILFAALLLRQDGQPLLLHLLHHLLFEGPLLGDARVLQQRLLALGHPTGAAGLLRLLGNLLVVLLTFPDGLVLLAQRAALGLALFALERHGASAEYFYVTTCVCCNRSVLLACSRRYRLRSKYCSLGGGGRRVVASE